MALAIGASVAVVRTRGWRPEQWSARERNTRLALAIVLSLALAGVAAVIAVVAAWVLGPDCGATPSAADRMKIAAFGVCLAVAAACIPVAIAGRRRVSWAVALPCVAAPLAVTLTAATSNASGWCLF